MFANAVRRKNNNSRKKIIAVLNLQNRMIKLEKQIS